jgi:hypothetical protein
MPTPFQERSEFCSRKLIRPISQQFRILFDLPNFLHFVVLSKRALFQHALAVEAARS